MVQTSFYFYKFLECLFKSCKTFYDKIIIFIFIFIDDVELREDQTSDLKVNNSSAYQLSYMLMLAIIIFIFICIF